MTDRDPVVFEAGPDDQPTSIEFERRGEQLVARIRPCALMRPTSRFAECLLSDPEVRAALRHTLRCDTRDPA
jgi:hypothetical protein